MPLIAGPETNPARVLFWYAFAFLLVPAFVNTFEIWTLLTTTVGRYPARLTPYIATAFALAIMLAGARRSASRRVPLLALGCLVAIGALFLSDPDFPAKRIHIPQYILLSVVLRRALSFDLGEPSLTVVSILMAAICGMHDEFLQGLHPDRGFGLRDIGLNGLGALSGGLLAAGLGLWRDAAPANTPPDRRTRIVVAVMFAASVLLVAPIEYVSNAAIPYWTMLPLLAALVAWMLAAGPEFAMHERPWRVLAILTFTLPIYPLATHVTTLDFH